MIIVTREQAVCMFFCEEYTESNVIKCSKKIDDREDIEICYAEDPTEPILLHQLCINGNPFKFKTYISKYELESLPVDDME
ncbi:uncharacterized protein BX664DRAFT_330332 [Halteromyces radiatus]|uniref:uncharacterized protein n=1 Tax=Halteromyces radiatus TaxID=101107 RepID=UPI00221F8400|nr:uncharacterized protein BX664DRAFT_330332 [Halteromyces radiatus]KAI8093689.1 hypothetical protein BX664DRAFT_330332 [Halteromyces radiatus]